MSESTTFRELASSDFSHLLKRMPTFELSYETMTHKKVSDLYDIVFAIPTSKKYIVWFSFYEDKNVCFLMELNRDKRIVRIQIPPLSFPEELSLGTVLYGSCIPSCGSATSFLIEDVLVYKGISLQTSLCNERLSFLRRFFECIGPQPSRDFSIYSACFFKVSEDPFPINIPYDVHHFQYRSFSKVAPYVNTSRREPELTTSTHITTAFVKPPIFRMSMSKPQYKSVTVFEVSADVQFDIYNLYACGKGGTRIYYNTAYIPNYKISVFMNSIFRDIKENRNLDLIEESDDEDEFQNKLEDRFVDLKKRVAMECTFSSKFKRWIPYRIASKYSKIVHVTML